MKKKKGNALMWLLLVLLPPIGIIYMWVAKKEMGGKKKGILTAVFAVWFIFIFAIGGEGTSEKDTVATTNPKQEAVKKEDSKKEESKKEEYKKEEPKKEEPAVQTEAPVVEDTAPDVTMGQKNALQKAQDYLNYTSFSYSGLVEQLKFDGFSEEDATYAVDNCNTDWNSQAAMKALDYLDYSSFSREGLIEQLEFDGFTPEQAEYGATSAGY